jgi:hypothetical protein
VESGQVEGVEELAQLFDSSPYGSSR